MPATVFVTVHDAAAVDSLARPFDGACFFRALDKAPALCATRGPLAGRLCQLLDGRAAADATDCLLV